MTNYDEKRITNAIAKLEDALEILACVADAKEVASEYSEIQDLVRALTYKLEK